TLVDASIEPIVISGSPLLVVRRMAKGLGVRRCYGLEVPLRRGDTSACGGIVNLALGRNKLRLVEELRSEFADIPIAFGNALSDLPMRNAAACAVYVTESPPSTALSNTLEQQISA